MLSAPRVVRALHDSAFTDGFMPAITPSAMVVCHWFGCRPVSRHSSLSAVISGIMPHAWSPRSFVSVSAHAERPPTPCCYPMPSRSFVCRVAFRLSPVRLFRESLRQEACSMFCPWFSSSGITEWYSSACLSSLPIEWLRPFSFFVVFPPRPSGSSANTVSWPVTAHAFAGFRFRRLPA